MNDYSLVVLAAESSPCTFAGNCRHSGQRDASRADVGTLAVERAVAEVLLQIVHHVAGAAAALLLAQRQQLQVLELRAVNRCAAPFGQAATQAPQPIQAA